MLRMGSSYEPHGLFRGHRVGLTPGHDDLPPAPPEEAELSKHLSQDVAQPIRDRVRFAVDPSAQLQCTPSSPSARPALALKGCGDAPAPMKSSDFRHMLLSLNLRPLRLLAERTLTVVSTITQACCENNTVMEVKIDESQI